MMDGVFSTKKSFRELDIPPRKLLTRRLASLSSEPSMEMYYQQNDSPKVLPQEILFYKFLPNSSLDDDSDPYASEHFRMYEFKICKCTRSRSHDWTDCPFAHPGEKARRRCPRRYNYSGTICADFRRGSCVRGDTCEFAHGVFECWLHPSRYRTEACKDGKNCQRKICFFAHTPSQLRSLDPAETVNNPGHCAYCRCYPGIHHTNSPTSILDINKLSPPAQLGSAFSPITRFSDRLVGDNSKNELMNSQEIMELMQSMKGMNINSIEQASNFNPIWVDYNMVCNYDDEQQSLFAYSPSTVSPSVSGSIRGFEGVCNLSVNKLTEDRSINESSTSGPDLEWVNDLLT